MESSEENCCSTYYKGEYVPDSFSISDSDCDCGDESESEDLLNI